jgi:integrase
MPNTLAKKYKNASTSKDWFWLFPNQNLAKDDEGIMRRHHVYGWAVQDAFKVTRRKCGLPEYTTPHTLRHCFATHFLQSLLDQRIPREMAETKLIEYMGHVDPKTLKWYLHLAAPENMLIQSPLDSISKG